MANSSETLFVLFNLLLLLSSATSVSFNIFRFESNLTNILYHGDVKFNTDGSVDLPTIETPGYIGQVMYADRVRLWDAKSGNLSSFSTNFKFLIETQANSTPAAGFTFFLAPVGFEFPINSNGGFLGLFNTSKGAIPKDRIVMVEFDTFWNEKWDPAGVIGHVGINNNTIASSVHTAWNISLHDRDTADVWISYDATTKNLSVEWKYQKTENNLENSSLSLEIDLRQSLPEWVIVGFSASTCANIERHTLLTWEFNSSLESNTSQKNTKTKTTLIMVGSLAGLIVVLIALIAMIWKKKGMVRTENSKDILKVTSINDDDLNKSGPRKFSYEELVSATKNFSEDRRLGQGGFGTVYRGFLPDVNMEVAVKKISRTSKQGKTEYMTEIKIISQLRHRNLVKLIGWCHERGKLLLVYEFMLNGSLDSHLFRNKRSTPALSWEVRYKTAVGLASGLLYLHEECEQCVVHRDIKSSNLMLDSNFVVKVGDFGLARLIDHDLGLCTTGLAGTFGYLAPECISNGRTSKESDVYSFGVVVLEISTGRYAASFDKQNYGLVGSVWDQYGKGQLHSVVDGKLKMNFDKNQAERLLTVGLWCAHPDFRQRPSIKQAIQVLNYEAEKPVLPTMMPIPTFEVPILIPSVELVGSSDEEQPSSGTISISSLVVGR